jgi:hypothetical protein
VLTGCMWTRAARGDAEPVARWQPSESEFFKAQRCGSTYAKPRVIACGHDLVRHIALPRGCLPDVMALLEAP